MKKMLSAICFIAIFFIAVPVVFAGASTQTLPNVRVTITAANVPTATSSFTFDTSPNVSMVIFTSDTAYAIMSANILCNTTVGFEYATLSTSTGYAQKQKASAAGAALSALSAVTMPSGTWTWMGGS